MDIKKWSKKYPRQYRGISGDVKSKEGTIILTFSTYTNPQTGEGCIQYRTGGKDYLIINKDLDIRNWIDVSDLIMEDMQNI